MAGIAYKASKRLLDFVISLIGLVATSPLMIAVAVLIKLSSPGPFIFKQKRVGAGGRLFTFYKFRTMIDGAEKLQDKYGHLNEADGPVFKIADDPRLTRYSKFLRDTNLDELPQLFNVLKGDMSLVGPRPPLPEEVKQYKDWQKRRLEVKPGLTSLWHAKGGNSRMSFDEWVKSDVNYVENQSLKLDLFIIYGTINLFLRNVSSLMRKN